MNSSLNLAFIGLGEHQTRAHLKHLYTLAQVGEPLRFVGAVDPDPDAFERIKDGLGLSIPRYHSVESLLAIPELDAVFIGSPDESHIVHLNQAVSRKIHVFCEKPLAVTLNESAHLARLLRTAESLGLVVSSCHPRRFDPPLVQLKANLDSLVAKHGKLRSFDFSFWYPRVTEGWKLNRSLLLDHFGHEIDLLNFLFGTEKFTATKAADSHDYYQVLGQTESGLTFRFMGSRHLTEAKYHEALTLSFEKEVIYLNLNSGEYQEMLSGEKTMGPPMDYDARFLELNSNFIDAVRGKSKSYLTHAVMLRNNVSAVELAHKGSCFY
ncbi:Gfo/Idh/MocA family oxidoreductase [Nostoc sp. CHAB 5834]|nr:Gfo/Idh/MocA family oxidoreductase [Nostoc sp. CHAB 5834]